MRCALQRRWHNAEEYGNLEALAAYGWEWPTQVRGASPVFWEFVVLIFSRSLQVRILQRAMKLLASDGRIVYSTCSLNPVENEAVIAEALKTNPGTHFTGLTDLRIINELLRFPPR